jgi:hypothetical protein
MIRMTKAEMVQALSGLISEDGGFDAFVEGQDALKAAKERFEDLAELLGAVYHRQIVAVAVIEVSGAGEPAVIGFGEPDER